MVTVKSCTATPLTETVTTVSLARGAPSSVAVTVTRWLCPAGRSCTRSGDTVRITSVEAASSSVIVSVAACGCTTPNWLSAAPDTSTSLSFASTSSLSTARTVTDPVLQVAYAGTLSTVPLRLKSRSVADGPGTVEIVTVVAWLDGWFKMADTRLRPPSSRIESGLSTSVTAGAASSSAIVTSAPVRGATVSPDDRPVTRTVSSGSSVESSTGASVKSAVPLFCPASIVRVKLSTAAKSERAAVPAPTASTTSVGSGRAAPSSSAVTVTVRDAPSWISGGDTDSVTALDGESLSVIRSVRSTGSPTPKALSVVAVTATRLFGAATSLSMAVIVTVPVLSVAPMGIVSVVPVPAGSPPRAPVPPPPPSP